MGYFLYKNVHCFFLTNTTATTITDDDDSHHVGLGSTYTHYIHYAKGSHVQNLQIN